MQTKGRTTQSGHGIHVMDLMTHRPLTVDSSSGEHDVVEMFEDGRIDALPVVDRGRPVGVWIRTDDGEIVLRGRSHLGRADAADPADGAIDQLLGGKEAVLVWDRDTPTGILTRRDLRRLLLRAAEVGLGRRSQSPPLVLRFIGSDGAGKTTLIMRTLPMVRDAMAGVVGTGDPPDDFPRGALEGRPAVYGDTFHARSGLDAAVHRLGNVELVLFEDRVGAASPPESIGEDLRILVASAQEAETLLPGQLRDIDALVVTKLDVSPEFDLPAFRSLVTAGHEALEVFGVAAAIDDRGLNAWRRWLQRKYLRRVHWE